MTNKITRSEDDGVIYARISGVMTVADQRALEAAARRLIEADRKVSLLVTLEHFEGWETNEAWGDDLQFVLGNEIARIAIVGDQRWRDQALMFVGKGFRNTQIEFFTTGSSEAAKAWFRR